MTPTDAELAELYARYAHVVYRRSLSILRNPEDAHDATQETFARAIRHWDTFREEASPLTWMVRISTNHCLNLLRNRSTRRGKLQDHAGEIAGEPADEPEASALDAERVRALLHDADDETRLCVIHTYFDDCTRQEVADLVGISVPTVRKRIAAFLDRARRALKVDTLSRALALFAPFLWSPP